MIINDHASLHCEMSENIPVLSHISSYIIELTAEIMNLRTLASRLWYVLLKINDSYLENQYH